MTSRYLEEEAGISLQNPLLTLATPLFPGESEKAFKGQWCFLLLCFRLFVFVCLRLHFSLGTFCLPNIVTMTFSTVCVLIHAQAPTKAQA